MRFDEPRVTVTPNGIGFLGLLALLFIALRLTGVIQWSWFWVLAPIWGPVAFGLVVVITLAVAFGGAMLLGGMIPRRRASRPIPPRPFLPMLKD